MARVAFITDASSLAGAALLKHLVNKTGKDEWTRIVIGSSTSNIAVQDTRVQLVELDFTQRPGQLIDGMNKHCADVTHAFFCSQLPSEDIREFKKVNIALFETFLLALTTAASSLENCTLLSNWQYYSSDIAVVPTPCREDDPRRGEAGDNIHHAQEDFLSMLQMNQNWTWNAIRPELIVCGTLASNEPNVALMLAIYFLITRALAVEAVMPTNQRCWEGTSSMSDAALLAAFSIWVATTCDCANEAFNFANGDHFTWRFFWPRLADHLGAYSTPDQEFNPHEPALGSLQRELSLADWARANQPVWDKLCDEAGVPTAKASFGAASWFELDKICQRSWTTTLSVNKARKFGWTGSRDSFETFSEAFESLRSSHLIP